MDGQPGLLSCIHRSFTLILLGGLSLLTPSITSTRSETDFVSGVATQCGFSWVVSPPPYKNANVASSKQLVLPNIQPEAHEQCILRWGTQKQEVKSPVFLQEGLCCIAWFHERRIPHWLPQKRGEDQEGSSFLYPGFCFYSCVQFPLEDGLVKQHCCNLL